MPLLSVIIPVYNAAEFLPQTLDSVLNQSLRDIEVICVDDGSTDASLDILHAYAKKDARVTVLQQRNQYAGAARNRGLQAATGAYVHFLDADDYVFDYAYECVYAKAKKHNLDYLAVAAIPYDMQLGQFVRSDYYMLSRIDPMDFNRLIDAGPDSPIHQSSVAPWSGIYRRAFLMEHGLCFNHLFCVNDKSFYYSVITNAERMMLTRDFVVAHRTRMSGSLVGVRAQHFDCHFKSFQIVADRLQRDGIADAVKRKVIRREFSDTLGWFEKFRADPEYGEQIAKDLEAFVRTDTSPYAELIGKLYADRCRKMADPAAEKKEEEPEVLAMPAEACKKPRVSVVVPVYNAEDYINGALLSLMNQTIKEIEIICVDDESTDSSPAVLKALCALDQRIRVYRIENAGAGAARNYGFRQAAGEYTYFFDSDDLCEPNLLELALYKALDTHADIVAFDFKRFYPDGRTEERRGFHLDHVDGRKEVFCYADCRDRIMNVINPTPWNKLYRTAFIREAGLAFEEISSSNDITFAAVSAAAAKRIAVLSGMRMHYRVGQEGTITSGKEYKLQNILYAVSSAAAQVRKLPYYEEIRTSLQYFVITQYVYGLKNNMRDLSLPVSRFYYEEIRKTFLDESFFADLKRRDFVKAKEYDNMLFHYFSIVRGSSFEEYCSRQAQEIIVSLTSYPARIGCVPAVVDAMCRQTHPADRIVLWLAAEQFPNREENLPEDLLQYAKDDQLQIEWCDDLRPHKKYFYAFQKYPDSIVITVDDDVYYPENLIESLFETYLLYPRAVSAARTHLMAVDTQGEILPYQYWLRNTDIGLFEPSMQLCATGAGGVLYPPHLLTEKLFDKEAIHKTCLCADDLWLKAMEIVSEVPVVGSMPYKELRFLPDSQETGLKFDNLYGEGNDVQLEGIRSWIDAQFYPGVLADKLLSARCGMHLNGDAALWSSLTEEHEALLYQGRKLRRDLKKEQKKARQTQLRNQLKKEQAKSREKDRKIRRLQAQIRYLEQAAHINSALAASQEEQIKKPAVQSANAADGRSIAVWGISAYFYANIAKLSDRIPLACICGDVSGSGECVYQTADGRSYTAVPKDAILDLPDPFVILSQTEKGELTEAIRWLRLKGIPFTHLALLLAQDVLEGDLLSAMERIYVDRNANTIYVSPQAQGRIRIHTRDAKHASVQIGAIAAAGEVIVHPDGDDAVLQVGDGTTFGNAVIQAGTDGTVQIGRACSFGDDVYMMQEAECMLFDLDTGDRIDCNAPIVIGDHVQTGRGVELLGGASIGAYSDIEAYSVVKGSFPPQAVIAGNPASMTGLHILKEGEDEDDG